ncbi:hypothetical protein TNCV_2513351 [Trichonephila clavipes]|nr:hypothetical protein TNCV_2513351 [Trichonephila clavipes]
MNTPPSTFQPTTFNLSTNHLQLFNQPPSTFQPTTFNLSTDHLQPFNRPPSSDPKFESPATILTGPCNVHRSQNRSWISDILSVKEFRDNWHQTLASSKCGTKDQFKMTDSEYSDLEEKCG